MKKIFCATLGIVFILTVFLMCSCAVPHEENDIIANANTIDDNTISLDNSLSEEFQEHIRERYSNPPIFDYSNNLNIEYTPIHTKDMILSSITIGMTKENMIGRIGIPKPYYVPPEQNAVDVWAYRKNVYPTTDGSVISFITSYAGTGTEADPFRAVISEIWCDGELIDACDTVAEEMELGILPTFLAVELHGTEYLISEGLLSEAEAVFYAEEQEIYLASQVEQESLPDAEIPETATEAVVQ